MGSQHISDILAFLGADSSAATGSEKVASDGSNAPALQKEASAMEKIASQIEKEQFEKMAQDGWFMGRVMAESFWDTLQEKIAIQQGDQRIAGENLHSVQGDPPMAAQRSEDLKGKVNVATPILTAAMHQAVTSKVPAPVNPPVEGVAGAAPVAQPPPPPDVQQTNGIAPKTASNQNDAESLLYQFLRSKH